MQPGGHPTRCKHVPTTPRRRCRRRQSSSISPNNVQWVAQARSIPLVQDGDSNHAIYLYTKKKQAQSDRIFNPSAPNDPLILNHPPPTRAPYICSEYHATFSFSVCVRKNERVEGNMKNMKNMKNIIFNPPSAIILLLTPSAIFYVQPKFFTVLGFQKI